MGEVKEEKKEEKTEKAERFHWAGLPLISVLKKERMKEARQLLEELEAISALRVAAEEREEEIDIRLGEIQREAGTMGLRHGKLCFRQSEALGRRTLDKEALVLKGVSVDVIAACMKTGKPYVKYEFRVIDLL